MYIDNDKLMISSSVSEKMNIAQLPDSDESSESAEPAETASWQPGADNSPGYAPISPNTPSWGPPSSITGGSSGGSSDNSPGYAPISPNTPSWGPPSSITGGSSGSSSGGSSNRPPVSPISPSWRPPSGWTVVPPVVVIPGQTTGSSQISGSRQANVRFLHAAANQPAVNIQLGNRTVINNMQFGNFTPYYLDSGNQRTLVTITNARSGQTLYRAYLNFADGTAYTVSIVNDGSGISLFTLTDIPCSSGNVSCLRAVNLSSNSGPVDIFLSGYGRLFQRVGQLAATGYRTIRQGTYRAMVSEALPCSSNSAVTIADGYVECNNTQIAIMDSATFNMMSGVTYTLYIIGLAYQFPALQILALESDLIY